MQELLLFKDFALPSVAPACAGIAAGPRSPLNTAGWLSPSPPPAKCPVKLDNLMCNDHHFQGLWQIVSSKNFHLT